jgi:hypothetical protein
MEYSRRFHGGSHLKVLLALVNTSCISIFDLKLAHTTKGFLNSFVALTLSILGLEKCALPWA